MTVPVVLSRAILHSDLIPRSAPTEGLEEASSDTSQPLVRSFLLNPEFGPDAFPIQLPPCKWDASILLQISGLWSLDILSNIPNTNRTSWTSLCVGPAQICSQERL